MDISKGIQFNQKVDYEKFCNLFHFRLYFDLKTTSHDHNQDDLTLDRLCYSYKQLQTLQELLYLTSDDHTSINDS